MRFEISHQGALFNNLKQIRDAYTERGTFGVIKEDEEGRNLVFPRYGFQTQQVDLPFPLKGAKFAIKSRGLHYTAVVAIFANSDSYLDGLSEKFAEVFREKESEIERKQDLEWFAVDTKGTGYLLKERTPVVAISRLSTEGSDDDTRTIVIGGRGTEPREIADEVEFIEWMTLLERVTTTFVRSVYEINKVKEKDIPLYLDCLA